MPRKPKKEIARIDGLFLPELMNQVSGIAKNILENMIASQKHLESARATQGQTSVTMLATVLSLAGNPNHSAVKMTRAIIKQIPNAKLN